MKLIQMISIFSIGCLSTFSLVKFENLNHLAFPSRGVSPIAQNLSLKTHPTLNAIVPLKDLNIPNPTVTGEATIKLEYLDNSRVFTILLNVGNLSSNFLFDTGASTTMISSALVQQLDLAGTPINNQELTSAVAGDDCRDMSANLHQLPKIQINQVEIKQLQALEFTNTIIPQNLSGVLGMDVLKFFDLKINPQIQQLQLLKPSALPRHQQSNAIPLTNKLGVMLASVTVNDQKDLTFMLDTGADLIFISQKLAQQLNLAEIEIQPIQVQGFCGLEEAGYSVLEQVKISQFIQNNLGVVILNPPSVLEVLEIDGIIGQNFLNFYQQYWRFHSNLDQRDGSLILEPNSN